jgi:hypothetical protein
MLDSVSDCPIQGSTVGTSLPTGADLGKSHVALYWGLAEGPEIPSRFRQSCALSRGQLGNLKAIRVKRGVGARKTFLGQNFVNFPVGYAFSLYVYDQAPDFCNELFHAANNTWMQPSVIRHTFSE